MIPFLTSTYLRLGLAIGLVLAVAFAGWRVNAWHDSHKRLPDIEAQLAAEIRCEPSTACQRRAEAWAAQARLEAEKSAQEALGKAQEAEAKARADASAWRAKYRAALATDPGCKAWSELPVACPL